MTDVVGQEESQLFGSGEEQGAGGRPPMHEREFGRRYNGRYKMPLLAGEEGTKSCPPGAEPWVPRGVQSTTEMVSAFAESRGLNIWQQEQMLYGLFRNPSLFEEACLLFAQWQRDGVDFADLKHHPEVRRVLTGGGNREANEVSIVGRAVQAAGANEARQAGTNRHTAWEHWCKTGEYIGTGEMQDQIRAMVELLERHHLEVIPDLTERVIRNTAVSAAGRFDNILLCQDTGRLLMADLKTKRKAFWTWMEVDAQLATYAHAQWMLDADWSGVPTYVNGPAHHVDQKEGRVLVMPSNGEPPYLRRADLEYGWRVAQKAREIIDMRAYGKSAERMVESALSLPM